MPEYSKKGPKHKDMNSFKTAADRQQILTI